MRRSTALTTPFAVLPRNLTLSDLPDTRSVQSASVATACRYRAAFFAYSGQFAAPATHAALLPLIAQWPCGQSALVRHPVPG
jgi:hypothetical protein